jgi:hypothetical protein
MNDYEFYLNTAFDRLDEVKPYLETTITWPTMRHVDVPTHNQVNMPAVKSVIFNKNATIVYFEDGTKCVVRKSAQDDYNREHAVVYAIVKRAYGIVNDDNTVDGNGMGAMLARVVKNGYDQDSHQEEQKNKKYKQYKQESLCAGCDIKDCEDRNAPFNGQPRDSKGRFVKKANRN